MPKPAVFVDTGRGFEPTELALGPWRGGALHGGAVGALLAHLVEQAEPARPVTRLTVDLLGPVPQASLDAEVVTVRSGRKVDVVRATLSVDGTPRATATALRVRPSPLELPEGSPPPTGLRWPPPDDGRPIPDALRQSSPFFAGLEFRMISGALGVTGPAAAWCRFGHVLVEGRVNTPLVDLVAAADNVYGIGSPIRVAEWPYVNVDLAVHLHRPPVGEWVLLDAAMRLGPAGTGLATATIADLDGEIGHAVQDVVVTPRR